jgi:hypothetical protein
MVVAVVESTTVAILVRLGQATAGWQAPRVLHGTRVALLSRVRARLAEVVVARFQVDRWGTVVRPYPMRKALPLVIIQWMFPAQLKEEAVASVTLIPIAHLTPATEAAH